MRTSSKETQNYVAVDSRTELGRLLADPASTGAVISGPIGSAKAALLELVLGDQLRAAIRLLCSPVLGEDHFGALSPLLVDFEESPNEVNVLRYLSHEFPQATSNNKPLVVVEEAHYLDAASAFVLTQLVQAGRIKLVLLAVGSGHLEPVVASTELGARLGRVALGSLSTQEVGKYANDQLDRKITHSTAVAISKICAGNPLLIHAFLRSARNQDILVESNGWYVLADAWVENDVHLAGAVSEIQKGLDPADAKALEIMALGGARNVGYLELVSGTDIGRLIGTGLVAYIDGDHLEITAPIYAQVLRDVVPPGRSIQLWREVSGRGQKDASLPTSLLWACESGEDISAPKFLEGATLANSKLDFHAAWRLCLYAGNLETDPRMALQGARAMLGLRRFQTAVSIVERVSDRVTNLKILGDLKAVATAALWRARGSREEIHGLLQDWIRRTEHLTALGKPVNHEAVRNQQFLQVSELWIDLVERRNLETLQVRAQACQEALKSGSLEYLMCADLQARVLMSLGKLAEAAGSSIESFEVIAEGSEDEFAMTYQILATSMQALFAVGDYAKIRSFTAQHTPVSPEMFLVYSGMLNFWAGFASVQEGRWATATDLLSEANAELAVHDPEKLLPLAEALLEFTQTQVNGLLPLNQAASHPKSVPQPADGVENRHAMLLAAAYRQVSRDPSDLEHICGLINQADAEQRFETVQQLLIVCRRFSTGKFPRDTSFEGLSTHYGFGRGQGNSSLVDAVSLDEQAETSRIIAVAEELYAYGETGFGAEMLAQAINKMSGPQDERARGVLLRKLSEWIRELGGTSWGPLREAVSERVLTSREKEIIDLVAQGLGNKEIARALTVSQRTVEGHLYRVFAKLGVSGREELGGQL